MHCMHAVEKAIFYQINVISSLIIYTIKHQSRVILLFDSTKISFLIATTSVKRK
jgi:hypothetical protein